MQRTVDILLVVSVLVNVVKGADLILRPHQQKWLQAKFDTITLWLDYTKPLEWYKKNESLRLIFLTLFILMPLGTFLVLSLPFPRLRIPLLLLMACALFTFFYMGAYKGGDNYEEWKYEFLSFGNIWVDITGIGEKLSGWLLNIKTSIQYITKPFLATLSLLPVAIIGYVAAIVFDYVTYKPEIPFRERVVLKAIFLIIVAVLAVGVIPIVQFGLTGLFILIISLIMLTVELLLKGLRSIAWRIVEYNKGVFAAIILIISLMLGMAEIYLRYSQQSSPTAPAQTSPSMAGTSPSP